MLERYMFNPKLEGHRFNDIVFELKDMLRDMN